MYTRILFNNIREYTPKFMKTIPYSKTVPQHFVQKASRHWRFNQTTSVVNNYKFVLKYLYGSLAGQVFLYWGAAYGLTQLIWQPVLFMYQSNNRHRQLDVAMKKEKEYQKRMEEEEDDDEDDEDWDDEE